jgi:Predicted nucleoside-diphosphate sugar epimerase
MELPFKLFVGGPVGSGQQYLSWIDIDDLVNGFIYALEKKLSGIA